MKNKPSRMRPAVSFSPRATLGMVVAILGLAACAPSLDWREVRPEGGGLQALFPCKPEVENRREPTPMGLAVCQAAGQSFSVSWAELADPAQVGLALRQMREALATKLAAPAPASASSGVLVPGMTPQPEAGQWWLQGARQQARVAVFARGLRVYQLTQLGERLEAGAWETFVTGLTLQP